MGLSEEHKRKISQANKGKKKPPFSEEHCRKLSEVAKNRRHSEETKLKMSETAKNRRHSKETKLKISQAMVGRKPPPHSEETRLKLSQAHKGIKMPPRTVEQRHRNFLAAKRNWKDPDYARKVFKGLRVYPNRPEKLLQKLLDRIYLGEWKFVGDGRLVIDGKVPDFVNVNGKKLLIEMFGDYWHSEEVVGEPVELHTQKRIDHFAEFGYNTLVVWESELGELAKVESKIRCWINNL